MRTVKLRSTTPTWLYINYEASAFLVCFDCQSSRTDLFVVKRGSLLNTTARKQKSWCLPQQCFFCVCVCGRGVHVHFRPQLRNWYHQRAKKNYGTSLQTEPRWDGKQQRWARRFDTTETRVDAAAGRTVWSETLCSLYSSKNFFKPQELQASWAHVCRGQCTEHGSSPPLGKKLCHLPPHTHTTCNSGNAVLLKRWNTLLTPEDQRGIKKKNASDAEYIKSYELNDFFAKADKTGCQGSLTSYRGGSPNLGSQSQCRNKPQLWVYEPMS